MHYLKYFLIILFSSLLLISCGDQGKDSNDDTDVPPPAMSPESIAHAECIKGTYIGIGDFTRVTGGANDFKLEVSHNSNEMIFLITDTEREGTSEGSKVCTTYQNPSFSAIEDNEFLFNLESDSVENKGSISDTTGLFSIVAASIPQEEGESAFCDINQLKLYREGDDTNDGSLGWLGSFLTVDSPSHNPKRSTDEEVRSFDEIKNDCNELVPAEEADVSGEAETTDNSAQPQETESQNPTQ